MLFTNVVLLNSLIFLCKYPQNQYLWSFCDRCRHEQNGEKSEKPAELERSDALLCHFSFQKATTFLFHGSQYATIFLFLCLWWWVGEFNILIGCLVESQRSASCPYIPKACEVSYREEKKKSVSVNSLQSGTKEHSSNGISSIY